MDGERIEAALARVRRGETQAFGEVVNESIHILRAHIRFYLSDPVVADDVLQEVYIQIFQGLDRYEPGTHFIAWAKTLTRHAALTARNRMLRRRKKRERYRLELMDRVHAKVEEAEQEYPIEKQISALHVCLETLTQRARTLVELHYFSRRDLAAAGREVGLSANAAAVALHRARKTLGLCIQQRNLQP